MRIRLVLAAPALVLALLTGADTIGRPAPPATAVAVVADPAPAPAYAGPTTGLRTDLANVDRALRFFAEAKRQEDERAAEAARVAARTAVARGPARDTSRTGSSATEPVPPGEALSAIAAHFGDLYDSAVGVARCESQLDPSAISPGGGNWGLFQINTVHRSSFEAVTGRPWSYVLNADANAAFARWLHDQSGGWGPWACRWAA